MVVQDKAKGSADLTTSAILAPTSEGNQTFTLEQVQERERKVKSDALSEVGKLRKAADDALKAAQKASEHLARMQRDQEEAELAAAKDEPSQVVVIRARQQLRQKENELAQMRESLEGANSKLTELTTKEQEVAKGRVAEEIADRLKVDAATLKRLAKYTDGSEEAIEAIAQHLPPGKELLPFRPDSNLSRGGSTPSVMDVRKKFIAGEIDSVQYEEKLKALGARP